MTDAARQAYRLERVDRWDAVAEIPVRHPAMRTCYHEHLAKVYRFLVPKGARILEVGCGHGELLAALEPKEGVGLDFAPAMIKAARDKHSHLQFLELDVHDVQADYLPAELQEPFDVIVLSDLVNDLWDVHEALERLAFLCAPQTRVLLNFHSHLWEVPARWAQDIGVMTPRLDQNWLTPEDLGNLLDLTGYEVIRRFDEFFWPWKTPVLELLCNRWLAKILPFRWLCLAHFMVCRPLPVPRAAGLVSVIIPARNEAGNIEAAVHRTPEMGAGTEIVFVEGNSTDDTWDVIQRTMIDHPERCIRAFRQAGQGKGDAVRTGFEQAQGDILMILDADLTVPPEVLPQFHDALVSGKAEFVNGVRLVYPQEKQAMRFFNLLGNKFFSLAFSWLLGRNIKDTLCGTKVLNRENYQKIVDNRSYFGDFDPFGDFDLIFGAAKLNLKMADLPVRYRERTYGETNISRWRDGYILLKMTVFAARRIKFVP